MDNSVSKAGDGRAQHDLVMKALQDVGLGVPLWRRARDAENRAAVSKRGGQARYAVAISTVCQFTVLAIHSPTEYVP